MPYRMLKGNVSSFSRFCCLMGGRLRKYDHNALRSSSLIWVKASNGMVG
jgi:hypothetical protein